MSEQAGDRVIFSLLEVTGSIQKTLQERYKSAFWVKAEMNKLNPHPPSGHCYPELVEKRDGRIIAEINANLWKDDYNRINATFLQVLKEPLKNGITILFSAKIAYDPVYGLRLRILDIDPSYSLGQLEKEKQDTIDQLKKNGIYDANRSTKMPLLPKRIAIVSVETSKGYSDFISTINNNTWGYTFFYMLFPAVLQGERAVDSIIHQLTRIRRVLDHFDVVAIIRGGGGDVGLTCYNNYRLAREIAVFPIPVLTGIGHSTNETVSEMIAFKNAITPTDLADYLLQKFHNYAVPVQRAKEFLVDQSKRIMREERSRLLHSVRYFRSVTGNVLIKLQYELAAHVTSLRQQSRQLLLSNDRQITEMEKHIGLLDPRNVLKRGYSLTYKDGRLLKSAAGVKEGDNIKTMLADGNIISTATQITKPEQP